MTQFAFSCSIVVNALLLVVIGYLLYLAEQEKMERESVSAELLSLRDTQLITADEPAELRQLADTANVLFEAVAKLEHGSINAAGFAKLQRDHLDSLMQNHQESFAKRMEARSRLIKGLEEILNR